MRKLLLFVSIMVLASLSFSIVSGQETVTLVFSDWHLTEAQWEPTLIDAINIFEEEHPNITVELDYVSYGEKETRYIAAIETGGGPDVFHLHAYSLSSFMERGYLYDLTSFIEKEDGVYGGDFLTPWYPQTLELMQDEQGNYFAIPGDFMAMVLVYNTAHFADAGLDPDNPPATWDEFLTTAQTLTRDQDGDGTIDTWAFATLGAINPGFELRFTPVLFSFGGDYTTADNKCSALNAPEAKEAFSFYVELLTEYAVVPPNAAELDPTGTRLLMAHNQISMKMGSGWSQVIANSMNPELNAFEVLAAAPVPTKAGTDTEFTTTAWLSAWGINPNSEHPEEAWELVKFITSKAMEERWFDDAQVLSARRDVSGGLEDQGVQGYENLLNDQFASVIASELDHAKFVPQIPEWPQIITMVNSAVRDSYTGAKTSDEALEETHNIINEILSGYRTRDEVCPPFNG